MPGMGGDTYHPMAFHPRGGGRAGGYFGSKEYPAVDPNSVGGGARGSGIPDNAGAGTGSCVSGPTAQGIDRSRFAKELANNPALKEKFFHIAAGEDSPPCAWHHRTITRSHKLFVLKSCRSAGTWSHPGVAMLLTGNCW